jgi:hypothetical protein
MNYRRATRIGSALALAGLAACDKAPDPPPPVFHAVTASGGSRVGFASFATDIDSSLQPVADDSPHEGGAFGTGIRPGRGPSGIVP